MKLLGILALATTLTTVAADKIKVLLIDGQKTTTMGGTRPRSSNILEEPGILTSKSRHVRLREATCGPGRQFSDYAVVRFDYNGESWSPQTQVDFVRYVRDGGGFVSRPCGG